MVYKKRVGFFMFALLATGAEQVAAKPNPAVDASLKAGWPFVEGELLVQQGAEARRERGVERLPRSRGHHRGPVRIRGVPSEGSSEAISREVIRGHQS